MEKSWKYITISVSAFICYCNTLWGSFLFDDTEAIVKNRDVLPSTSIGEIFKNDFWGTDISLNSSHKSYRPLTILSYRLNVIYSNNILDSFQFHATNVILYGLLCLLTIPVFELFLKKRKHEYINEIAFMSSLLFTVHPVHTESVAAIVGRADILGSILFLVTLLLYHGCLQKNSVLLLFMAIFTTIAAVLCKENAIMALVMCMAYDIFQQKKKKRSWENMLNLYFISRNLILVFSGSLILYYRLKIMNFEGPIFTSIDNPAAFSETFFVKVFTYSYIYILNLLILIWPNWLCFDWSMGCIPLIENFCDIRIVVVCLFWILSIAAVYKSLKKIYITGLIDGSVMGICLMVLPFIPASNLFFVVGFVIAERTLLLPSAGFCFLVVIGFYKLGKKLNKKKIRKTNFYILCIIFACRTIMRNFEWLKEETLFSSALEVCPLNAKVHYNIAKVAADQDLKELAFVEYRKALELNPNYEQAMNNLANLLREEKKYVEAENLLRKSLDVRPNFAAAWMNLGIVLTNLNNSKEAEYCYKTAIKYRSRYPDCYYNLGNLYLDQKRNEEALKAWEMAVFYRPTHVAAWSNTLVLLDSMKRYQEALDLAKTALSYNPLSPALHFSIANTLGKVQEFDRAEAHFLEAINLNSNNALYVSNLGVLYHRWGKLDKARSMYQRALKIDPNMKTTQLNLRKLNRR
ncbi:protein O-mannosyl-transferase TMTC4 [Harmonia axyridis]|uniref:protein O-mannosyl-transferase TMTC4 n=1 Tax=Harmonia axyridis TaxID=115357 RepID=UPI001E277ADF|nr:protein O-mannosyl-transferase TMTC4 [Harmonia axyridis]